MKRTVAFLAAVCLSTGILSATVAWAQYSPPQTPPPPPPTEASGDTIKSKNDSPVAPAAEPKPKAAPAPTDTMSSAAKARRMHLEASNPRSYVFSLGLGSGLNYKPENFKDDFSPYFGGTMAFGVRQYGFQAGINFGYNFYLADGTVPNDLNILTIFAELMYTPFKSTARPYIVACGGYFKQWIVDLDYTENVLGYGGGAGVDVQLDRVKRLFFDVRYIQGQTRETQNHANTEIVPMRLGVSWEFR